MNYIQEIFTWLTPALEVVLQVGVCIVVFMLIVYVNNLLKERGIDITKSTSIDLENLIIKVVRYINQTVVDNMKEQSENGKLTDSQIADVKNKALSMIYELINSDMMNYLIDNFNDYEPYVEMLIENAVVMTKNDRLIATPIEATEVVNNTVNNEESCDVENISDADTTK